MMTRERERLDASQQCSPEFKAKSEEEQSCSFIYNYQSLNKERALQEEAVALNNEAKYKKSKDGDSSRTHLYSFLKCVYISVCLVRY